MIRGFYAARSGLLGQQQNMNIIANNFANINTAGFKPQQASFEALLYAKVNGGAGVMINTGHGSRVESSPVNFEQSGLVATEVPTDMAIIGDGFFAVEGGEEGDIYYTRDGRFSYSLDGDMKYPVDGSGRYLLDADGARIELEGREELTPDMPGVFRFPNRHGLTLAGSNVFAAAEDEELGASPAGDAEPVEGPDVRAGYLERSGVSAASEVVRMIESQRAFSFNARALTTIDEMDDVANQMR
jgi:flagellar basal body rod protein FlgG